MVQSFTRPTPPALPTPIRRMLERAIQGDSLELPLLPDTAMQVMEACNDDGTDASSLSKVMERDQSLASHVLRIANSAAYAPKEPIASLQQAVSRLGIGAICEIAVSIAVKGRVFRVPGYQVQIREMWMHSAAAGVYSKEIARQLDRDVESAFMCGLLHDVGKPIVMQTLIDEVGTHTDKPIPPSVMEAAIVEFHELVGAMMARQWALPEWIVEAISHHHEYDEAGEYRGKVMITNLSDELCHWALGDNTREEDFPAELPVIEDLDLAGAELISLLEKRGRVLEVVEAFL